MTIELEGIRLLRAARLALDDVSLTIAPGEVVGVLGENGAGKSTLIDAVAGEVALAAGQIMISGRDLSGLDVTEQARCRAVLPQKPSLSFDLTVTEVAEMGAYPFREASPSVVDEWVAQALGWADLTDLATRRYLTLSGGEQQRAQLARVLVQGLAIAAHGEKPFILLDEPAASLDARHQIELMRCLRLFATRYEAGVLVALHDINLGARWCDRLILLGDARVVSQGSPQVALTSETLKNTFGLDMMVMPHPLDTRCVLVLDRVTC
ncbi:MAG: heme ABC transporter ATP-binding protein [Betaproteobacteria bacterium]